MDIKTRRKLKELGFVWEGEWCFRPHKLCYQDSETKDCSKCEHYLPDPTLEELISAVDEKTDVKWGIERELVTKKIISCVVWFGDEMIFTGGDLDDVLARGLIWLYEKEE